jgi:UDP-N-acetylmuramyl pentapeptide phosphotransferase/UDP-N-acetylglucosamine-1-phosphate transferase
LALTAVLAILSLLDDRMKLPVAVKLLTHISMACGVVWGAGLIIRTIDIPLAGTIALGWLGAVLTVAFIVWMINLYNFMDGMDGFAGGMTVLGFGFLSLFGWMRQHQFMLAVSAMVSVATAGFLIYNMPPARIFMGDVGSTVIGFLAAVLVVTGVHGGVFSLWVPMLIFSPFIVDATATLFRRLFRGERIWEAHRQHYYQRLVLAGWGHRAVVLSEYGLMLLCGAAATVYSRVGDGWRLLILGVWVVTFVVLAGTVRNLERRHAVSPRG